MKYISFMLMGFAIGMLPAAAQIQHLPSPIKSSELQKVSTVKMMKPEFVNNSRGEILNAPRRADAELFEVICTTPQLNDWRPLSVTAYQEGYRSVEADYTGIIKLSAGTYDFVASFDHVSSASYYGTDYRGLVILENVTIDGPTTIDFDPSTATNHLTFKPLLPNGETLEFRHVVYDDMWTETVVSEGNFPVSLMSITYTVGTEEWDSQFGVSTDGTIMDTPYGQTSPEWSMEIYVNEVSDRINIGFTGIFGASGDEYDGTYVMSAEQAGSSPASLSNDSDSWTDTTLTGAWTPRGSETLQLIEENGLAFNPYGLRFLISGGNIVNSTTASSFGYTGSQKIYFSNGNSEENYVKVMIAPVMSEVYKDGFEFKGISNIGGYLWFEGNNKEELTCIPIHLLPYTYSKFKILDFNLPGCGAFVADEADNLEVDFATAPALFSLIYDDYWAQGNEYYSLFHVDYIGRLGESRYTDKMFAECNATVDGVSVATSLEGISQWLDSNSDRLAGKLEISLVDNNFEVNGIPGGNNALITSYLDNDDFYPPSLTMLQFRDAEGKVTSSFESGEIRLSASDINFSRTDGTYYCNAPASVKCEFAQTGTDQFQEISLTENPEFWSDEILGSNFTGNLSSSSSAPGWYDLRITVKDDNGNTQQQTIKMAFELKGQTAVMKINDILASEYVEWYGVDGIKISNDNLTPGIYIVRTAAGTVKKVRIIR